MSQTSTILTTLKQALKSQSKTYADVARALDLSEASVKRLFAEQTFSLQRLEKVCQLLDMDITDLIQQMSENRKKMVRLTITQERDIAGDVTLLLIAACVLNRWSYRDITKHYAIADTEAIRCLATLDRLQILELLPGNRIRLRVSPNFSWHPDGPIQQFFQDRVAAEYFSSRFTRDTEKLLCLNGMLSNSSNQIFQQKIQRLAREFDELNDDDAGLPISERHGTTVVLAIRQWEYGLFRQYRREKDGLTAPPSQAEEG